MIRELKKKGWTISAIARETGFDRKTIRKHLKSEAAPQSKRRKKRECKLDPYKLYLLERIKEGTTNCAVLMEEIKTKGYEGKSTILREFGQPHREAPKKQATVRFETIPGRQAQVDWAENIGEFYVDDSKRPLYAFIMMLSYSHKRYIEFTTDMTQETLMKCHMNAFSYFNGIPQQLLYEIICGWSLRNTASARFSSIGSLFQGKLAFKTIYRWLYLGKLHVTLHALRQKGKRQAPRETRGRFNVGTSIQQRPKEVKTRETFDHWELGTVVSAPGTKGCMATFAERKTRCYVGIQIPNRSAQSMKWAIEQLISRYPR